MLMEIEENNVKHKLKFYIQLVLLLAIMTAIFMFSSQTFEASYKLSDGLLDRLEKLPAVLPWFNGNDGDLIRKLAHFAEYTCIGLASCLFFREIFFVKKNKPLLCFAFSETFCVLYAVTDEIHQLFVDGRTCQAGDILIDSAGALLGILAALFFASLLDRKA